MDTSKYAWAMIGLGIVIVILGVFLIATPAKAPTNTRPTSDYTYLNASADTIVANLPKAYDVVGKEFSVLGKARGSWYFEGSFPVQLLDKEGNVLASGPAQVNPEGTTWMTNEFVPFKINLKVTSTYIGPATLVLKKDNPSGIPAHDASLSYPITVEY